MIEINAGVIVTMLIAICGAAIGYGALRKTVEEQSTTLTKIGDIQSDCVTRAFCESRHDVLDQIVREHVKTVKNLDNFARWWLATHGKSPEEIKRIMINGNT